MERYVADGFNKVGGSAKQAANDFALLGKVIGDAERDDSMKSLPLVHPYDPAKRRKNRVKNKQAKRSRKLNR